MLYQSLLQRLQCQHEAIPHIIAGIDEERLLYKQLPAKWSIKDNIAHLAKYQLVFFNRMNFIIKQNCPSFDRYNSKDDTDFERWKTLDINELLYTVQKDRKTIFNLICGLTENQLARKGMHPKYGALTLMQWTEFFLLHEAHHIYTIFQLAFALDNAS